MATNQDGVAGPNGLAIVKGFFCRVAQAVCRHQEPVIMVRTVILVMAGGIIPEEGIAPLKAIGVSRKRSKGERRGAKDER